MIQKAPLNQKILTLNQKLYVKALKNPICDIVITSGAAGSGKTKFAVDAGIDMLEAKKIRKIIITRPLAIANDQAIGFMPGGLKEKMLPWMMPIYDAINSTASTSTQVFNMTHQLEAEGKLEIIPFAFMRGRTFKNSWIICDEAQNCTSQQLLMLLTRLGTGSKMVLTGDPEQCDVPKSGFADLLYRIKESTNPDISSRISLIEMEHKDVMRHDLIPHLISLYLAK